MNFLVLVFCVCAASAAVPYPNAGRYNTWRAQPIGVAKATAEVSYPGLIEEQPVVPVFKTVPVTKTIVPITKAVVPVPEVVIQPLVPVTKAVVKPVNSFVPFKNVEVVQDFVAPVAKTTVQQYAKYTPTTAVKNINGIDKDVDAVVVRSESDVLPDGFKIGYETSNGIAAASTGYLKKVDNTEALNVEGHYRYISPEGIPVEISYIANEYGYQPKGDVLPVAPPVPVAIARSLEYIANHPNKELEGGRKF